MSSKRKDYISKETLGIFFAQLAALRSKNSKQAGAYIESSDHKFLSYGYNGYPREIKDTDLMRDPHTAEKQYFLLHAEENAILNAPSRILLRGATMYTTYLPCNECMKSILQVGIRRIVYEKDYDPNLSTNIATWRMIKASGIECVQYTGPAIQITASAGTPYISRETFYMGICEIASKRSKDPNRQIGACIVNTNTHKIISFGYNGFPKDISDDEFPWVKNQPKAEDNKFMYVVHAEKNAVLSAQFSDALIGATVYVELFPCNECAKILIQSGIKEVVYRSDEDHHKITAEKSRLMFEHAGVSYHPYQGDTLHFNIVP